MRRTLVLQVFSIFIGFILLRHLGASLPLSLSLSLSLLFSLFNFLVPPTRSQRYRIVWESPEATRDYLGKRICRSGAPDKFAARDSLREKDSSKGMRERMRRAFSSAACGLGWYQTHEPLSSEFEPKHIYDILDPTFKKLFNYFFFSQNKLCNV